ncbi:ParB/RepB/Spo0J family partition protein [Aliivibrio fischeri]|uniref:ParB/RepB/Spo0J family partition protein n=1 Tax=Aliivibrio fischeri TaxID=668 RepID=UPI0012D9B15D|nr:ParB N-terminal domain-containing protein [Aliivibrio fischeri]MUJ20374.1 hypothetical protein [Aliivibrio fischeri]
MTNYTERSGNKIGQNKAKLPNNKKKGFDIEVRIPKTRNGENIGFTTEKFEFDFVVIDASKLRRCKVSELNPRNAQSLDPNSISDIASDIEEHCQIQPVWGYVNPQAHDEIIIMDGSRRLAVANLLQRDLNAFVSKTPFSLEALKIITNSLSKTKELSLYERGLKYAAMLDNREFTDAVAIGKHEGVSDTIVRSAIKAARLPDFMLFPFENPSRIGRPTFSKIVSLHKTMKELSSNEYNLLRNEIITELDYNEIESDMRSKINQALAKRGVKHRYDIIPDDKVIQEVLDRLTKLINYAVNGEPVKRAESETYTQGRVSAEIKKNKASDISVGFKNLTAPRAETLSHFVKAFTQSSIEVTTQTTLGFEDGIPLNQNPQFAKLPIKRKREILLFIERLSGSFLEDSEDDEETGNVIDLKKHA